MAKGSGNGKAHAKGSGNGKAHAEGKVHGNGNGRSPKRNDGKIRVAIVGVGNCASSLVQGRYYYENAADDEFVPGLMPPKRRRLGSHTAGQSRKKAAEAAKATVA